jgi:acyl carrier protein
MKTVTANDVRQFLIRKYAGQIKGAGADEANIPDTFDFLLTGVIDSVGVLEMVASLEKEFGLELDLTDLDAEKMTIIGPLSDFVAAQAQRKAQS